MSQLTGPTCEDCIVSGRYLYSVDTNSFDIVDITNATAPRRVFSTTTSNGEKVRVQGSYAYAILGGNSVRVFDVTNATSPIQIASIALTSPSALAVSGRFLYVNNSTAVRVYDIADPNNPTLLGSVAIGNTPGEIDVAGKYLYITHNDLSVVDVSSSTNPRIVIQDLSLGSNGIDVYGRYGVVGISGGIQIIDFGGLETHAARIGALEVGSITGWNDADFGGTLRVGTSLQVGRQGIFTLGSLAVGATNTTSTIEYAVSSTRGEFSGGLSVGGVSVCLSNGTNCPAGSGTDTLQSVTARGSFTTTTAQFFGGFVAASSSVTGTFAVAGTSTFCAMSMSVPLPTMFSSTPTLSSMAMISLPLTILVRFLRSSPMACLLPEKPVLPCLETDSSIRPMVHSLFRPTAHS
ncbi:beta-propeller domain-containing protein [Candidatus Uhrbacteria bacterium]|nr:MAG: beta-propeller domain-containing protein [Candidatus Uhrbacteria bacterium]